MGVSPCISLHARDRDGPHRRDDRGQAKAGAHRARRYGPLGGLILALAASVAAGDPIRVAVYHTELSRDGPGLLLRDILAGEDQVRAVAEVIATARPDILLLLDIDYDAGAHAVGALSAAVADAGHDLPHLFSRPPNRGLLTGDDLDGDGRVELPDDAQGWADFAGQGGMALLSRFPVDAAASFDFSDGLWHLQAGALADGVPQAQRLSTSGHWDVAVILPDGTSIRIWAWHATPPVFDGPEDRNGRRNHDEAAFWLNRTGSAEGPFVLLGAANLDAIDGDGRAGALSALLSHPRLQDPKPESVGGAVAAAQQGGVNLRHRGDPALDTADWPEDRGPGNLRVDYVLPSSDWRVLDAGVWWPGEGPGADLAARASRHRLVWADLELR